MGCVTRAPGGAGCGGLVGCLRGRVASRFLGVAGGYWRVVGEGVPPPPFFVAAGVPLGWGKRKVAAWGKCLVFSFCVKGVVSGGCEVACEW